MTTEKQNWQAQEIYGCEYEKLNRMEKHRVDTIIRNQIKDKLNGDKI